MLPGKAIIIAPLKRPAVRRESIAVFTLPLPYECNACSIPVNFESNNSSIVSMVRSRGPKPVPPEVSISSTPELTHWVINGTSCFEPSSRATRCSTEQPES